MALVTVLKFVMTFALGYVLLTILGPIVHEAGYSNQLWNNMPVSEIAFRDQTYGIWTTVIVIMVAILLIIAWRESERKAVQG